MRATAALKHCPKCRRELPASAFGRDQSRPDGLNRCCRECARAYHNTPARAAYRRAYRATHKSRVKAREALYRQRPDRREARRKASLQYYRQHPEKARARRHAQSDELRLYSRRYREEHPGLYRKYLERWRSLPRYSRPPQRARARRNAATRGAAVFDHITPRQVFDRDGWLCGCCGKPVDSSLRWPHPFSASVDHIVPLSRGGSHTYDNVQLTHLRCNLRKHARPPA